MKQYATKARAIPGVMSTSKGAYFAYVTKARATQYGKGIETSNSRRDEHAEGSVLCVRDRGARNHNAEARSLYALSPPPRFNQMISLYVLKIGKSGTLRGSKN